MRQKISLHLLILIAITIVYFPSILHSQSSSYVTPKVVCISGHESTCLDFMTKRGTLLINMHQYYTTRLAQDMLVSSIMTSVVSIPVDRELRTFSIGAYMSFGGTPRSNVWVQNGSGYYESIPERGLAYNPSFYGGLNVGWVFALWKNAYDETICSATRAVEDARSCQYYNRIPIISNITIYGSGNGGHGGFGFDLTSTKNRSSWASRGWMLRYSIFNSSRWLGVIFNGLSVGYGMSSQWMEVGLDITDPVISAKLGGYATSFSGTTNILIRSDNLTKWGDVRTGFSIFDFLHFYVGFGMSSSTGSVIYRLKQEGWWTTPIDYGYIMASMDGDYHTRDDSILMRHIIGGISAGGFTVSGAMTIGPNEITRKRVYSATLGYTFYF